MRRPRILYVTPLWPATPRSASEVRALHIGGALQHVGEVEIALVGQEGEQDVTGGSGFRVVQEFEVSPRADTGWARKARWLFDSRLPQPHGVGVDGQSAGLLPEIAREFDLVWFFKLRTANMFPQWRWPRSVVDVDDVPSLFEQSVAAADTSTAARLGTLLRLWSWQRREKLLGERFDVVTVCSESDRRYLGRLGVTAPIRVVANGFERPAAAPVRRPAVPPRLGFIGVFDHAPNAEGIGWFVRDCWPRVKREVPDARLRLVGRYTDGPLKPVGNDIDALGYVADANEEMATWSAMVVPVHTGAGTRGKIAHAFSQKCPVVSTSLGAYGYEPRHGHDMLLGDSAERFADACLQVLRDPEAATAIAERAWQQFLERWTWDAINPEVWKAAEQVLRSPVPAGQERTLLTHERIASPPAS